MANPNFYWMNALYSADDPGLSMDPNFTTVMLRNIPNKYTTKMLLEVLDKRFAKQYDYVYLPVDFVNLCNVGYAFLNLKTPEARARFYRCFHNQKVKEVLPGFNSKKVLKQVCEVNKAKVQGAKENIRRIRQMNMLMQRLKDHPDWVPLQFDNNGNAIPLDLDAPIDSKNPSPKGMENHGGASNGSNSTIHNGGGSGQNMTNGGNRKNTNSNTSSYTNQTTAGPGLTPLSQTSYSPLSYHLPSNGGSPLTHLSPAYLQHAGDRWKPYAQFMSPYDHFAYSLPAADTLYAACALQQQAQAAYSVAVASATAAAVAGSPGDWSDGKENWGQCQQTMPTVAQPFTKGTPKPYWDKYTEDENLMMQGYQFQ